MRRLKTKSPIIHYQNELIELYHSLPIESKKRFYFLESFISLLKGNQEAKNFTSPLPDKLPEIASLPPTPPQPISEIFKEQRIHPVGPLVINKEKAVIMQKYRFEFYIGYTNHAGKKIGFIDTWEEERYIIPNTGRSSREMTAWNKWWSICK